MLIIYAHPNKDGHNGAILKELKIQLKRSGISYELLDLYKMNYQPKLLPNEHYTSGHRDLASETIKIQEKIKNTDKLIFIYPTWWQNMPAILKGFLDRTFVSHFAFKYDGAIPVPLLKGKKATIFTTTGAPRIITKLVFGDRSLKVLIKDTLNFCGIKGKGFIIDNAKKYNHKKDKKIRTLVKKGLKYLR